MTSVERSPRRSQVLGLWSLLVTAACAPALHAPRPLPATPAPPDALSATSSPESVDEILRRAAERFGARRDPAAAEQAQELFLAAANADPARTDGLVGVVRAAAWRIEHSEDAALRARLIASELDAAQWCVARAGALAATEARTQAGAECGYWLAIALGQQAREHPTTAMDALERLVAELRAAAAVRPALEQGGPDRVLALVLLRAPGWPAGPGDAEEGLAAARRAMAVAPGYPPNRLALAEALLKNGAAEESRSEAGAARDAALAASDPDAGDWVAEAEALLR